MTGNGNDLNLLKLNWKNSWNHFRSTYFWRVWAICLQNSWNCLITLTSAAVWQILNMKWMKWNERKWKWFKSAIIVWKNSWNHFRWTYFLRAITYVCSSLTNFEYEVKEMTGNGSDLNFLKLAGKNSWNHFEWTYVLQIWAITYVCSSSLTNCEYEVNEMTGNGNDLNLLKLAWEKFMKPLQVNIFLAGLGHL